MLYCRHESGLDRFFDCEINFKDTGYDDFRKIIESSKLRFRKFKEPELKDTVRFYHGLTRGFILNELFSRVEPKKRYMNQYFNEEIVPILSKNDPNFKIYLKGKPSNSNDKVYHIKPTNKIWFIYHTVLSFIFKSSFHLPSQIFFNRFGLNTTYTDFKGMGKAGQIAKMPKCVKNYIKWDRNPATMSKQFENENDLKIEWLSATGISNAHSMGKFMSYCLCNYFDAFTEAIKYPIKRVDGSISISTDFTQGGFCKVMANGIEWYGWGGLGGSYYMYAPKYKCVLSYLVTGIH